MKPKFIEAYMDVAERFAQLSSAKRLQVGAIVVKDDRIVSIGYNGMPTGWDNCCEDKNNKTKPEVLHAEANAVSKLARSPESAESASIFITHSPCIDCAKLIYQSGIATVYYKNDYRSTQGIEFLNRSDIEVVKVD
jgi:dCMP deaminase